MRHFCSPATSSKVWFPPNPHPAKKHKSARSEKETRHVHFEVSPGRGDLDSAAAPGGAAGAGDPEAANGCATLAGVQKKHPPRDLDP